MLTLHDYDNEGIVVDVLGEAWWSALAAKNEPLLLRLEGSNKLTADPYGYTEAISLMDADLTIAGTDSLEIKANYGIYDWDSSSVTINGGTVNVTTIDSGIHAENNLTINGGAVTIDAEYCGIESYGDVILRGGVLEVTALSPVQASDEIICSLPLPQGVEIIKSSSLYVPDTLANKALYENGVKHTVRLSAVVPAAPATGDNAQPLMWMALALISAVCGVSLVRNKRGLLQK